MYLKIESNNRGIISISDLGLKKIIIQVILDLLADKISLYDIDINLNHDQCSLFVSLNINNKNINIYQYANKINQQINQALQHMLNFQIKNIHTIFNN